MTEKEWRKEEIRLWDGLAREDMLDFPYKLETMIQLIDSELLPTEVGSFLPI